MNLDISFAFSKKRRRSAQSSASSFSSSSVQLVKQKKASLNFGGDSDMSSPSQCAPVSSSTMEENMSDDKDAVESFSYSDESYCGTKSKHSSASSKSSELDSEPPISDLENESSPQKSYRLRPDGPSIEDRPKTRSADGFFPLSSLDGMVPETKPSEKAVAFREMLTSIRESKKESFTIHKPSSLETNPVILLKDPDEKQNEDHQQENEEEVQGNITFFSGVDLRNHKLYAQDFPPWVTSEITKFAISHSSDPMVTLHYEMLDFEHFISCTVDEHAERERLVRQVTDVVVSIWPQAHVNIFGSFATGLYLPTSDIDLCVMNTPHRGDTFELHKLAAGFRKIPGFLRKIEVIDKARVPLVKIISRESNTQCDISFSQENATKNVGFIRECMGNYPALRPLVLIAKCCLQQRGLNEVFKGGLGSYAIFLMVLSHLQMYDTNFHDARVVNLGTLLKNFFYLYGVSMNTIYAGIDVKNGGRYYEKRFRYPFEPTRPFNISIMDPLDVNNEIGRNSYGIQKIRQTFQTHFMSLSNYNPAGGNTFFKSPLSILIKEDSYFVERMSKISPEDHPLHGKFIFDGAGSKIKAKDPRRSIREKSRFK